MTHENLFQETSLIRIPQPNLLKGDMKTEWKKTGHLSHTGYEKFFAKGSVVTRACKGLLASLLFAPPPPHQTHHHRLHSFPLVMFYESTSPSISLSPSLMFSTGSQKESSQHIKNRRDQFQIRAFKKRVFKQIYNESTEVVLFDYFD